MNTALTILRASGARLTATIDLPEDPNLAELRADLRPFLGDADPEHVAVLNENRRADMFVDEDGHGKRLPRNEAATTIYRASWMERHPKDDPESLPWIAGDAVIFGRTVWR